MKRLISISIFCIVIGSSVPASAGPVLYSTGFENPPFTSGLIAGQNGWAVFGPGISTVTSFFAKSGTQSAFVDGGTLSQSGPYHADTSNGPILDLSADIAIFASANQTVWQFAGTGPSLIGFIGGVDIQANNQIKAISAGFPVIGTFPKATAFDGTAWHHIDLLFNMTAQTYSISLDNALLASNLPFCGNNSGACSGASVPTYGDGFFDSFGTGNDSAYMDNFSLVNVVPEPSTILPLLGALGAMGAALRRRSLKK